MAATEAQGGDAEATSQVLAVCLRSSLTAAFERHVEAAATEAADASGGSLARASDSGSGPSSGSGEGRGQGWAAPVVARSTSVIMPASVLTTAINR